MRETPINSPNNDESRKIRIRNLVKSLKRSQLVRFCINNHDEPKVGTLEWASGGERISAKVELRADPQPNGRVTLQISPWPAELQPLVLYHGVPGFCRIKELKSPFGLTHLRRDLPAVEHQREDAWSLQGGSLRADSGEESFDIDSADIEPEDPDKGWIDLDLSSGRLEVHAELEENADPGMIFVEIRWLDLDGEDVRNQFTMELTECDDDNVWSGRIRVDLPMESLDGQIWVTARSLTADDIVQLSSDERGGEPSEVNRLIARSRFSVHGTQINQDRLELTISDVDLDQLNESSVDEWLIRATDTSSQSSDLEDAGGEDESLPFEEELHKYRDDLNAKLCTKTANRVEEELIWIKIHKYYRPRFPSWDDEQFVEAINSIYLQIDEKGLPEPTEKENLTAWLKTVIDRKLRRLYKIEKRHHQKRESGSEIDERLEDGQATAATNPVPDMDGTGIIDRFLELLTQEQLGYWAMKNWLQISDVEIRESMNLSEHRVRSLAERIARKLFIFQGLEWISKSNELNREPINFTQHEQKLVMRYEFDGLDTDNAVSAVGLNVKNGRRLLRDGIKKVELAAAAFNINLPDQYFASVVSWFDPSVSHSSTADVELHHVGRRLHGQILVSTLPRKKLKKPSRKFIQYRIIERKGLADTFACICSHYKSNGPSPDELQAVPDDVVHVWNNVKSAVPDGIRLITADWLCTH